MKTSKLGCVLGIMFFIWACVTINIYFPTAEVQKAAEEIVKEVREQKMPPQEEKQPETKPQSWRWELVPSVYAQERALEISNASIRALKASIKQRYPKLKPFLAKGILGENNQGFLEVRTWQGLDLKQRAEVKRLLEAENKDRKMLYQEVAKALQIEPQQIGKLQQIFANEWQKTAPAGTWIQTKEGKWIRK
jgi:uncharacterized protein YdbL (DUF1318 family)